MAGAAAVVLLVGCFYAVVFQPLDRRQDDSMTRLMQLDELLIRSGTEGREYRQLRDKLVDMQDSIAEVNLQLRDEQQEERVLADLNSIASSVGLEILEHQLGQSKMMSTHLEKEIELRCSGSYASICRFLEQAEKITKTTKLSRFELNEAKNSRSYPIQLTFVLYSRANSHDTKEKRGVL